MDTTNRRIRYPWIMQIILTVLGLVAMWWIGWFTSKPDNPILIGIQSQKTGWVSLSESPLNWSIAFGMPASLVGVVVAVVAALVPMAVWVRRRRAKPAGLFCCRCHEDMEPEGLVVFHNEVLMCEQCAKSLQSLGEKDFVKLAVQRS